MTTRVRRSAPAAAATATPAKQLAGFIAKFDPDVARLIRTGRTALRKRFPTALELVYDNYNALAIGYGPNERTSEAFVSLACFAKGVHLYFTHGKSLPDPDGILEGGGNQGRFVRFRGAATVRDPRVAALLSAASRRGPTPLATTGRGITVIKSISAKQRPRRASEPSSRAKPAARAR